MTQEPCKNCGLDYEHAKDVVEFRDYQGVCNNCGNPTYYQRLIVRWMYDVPDGAGCHHIFACLPVNCLSCNKLTVVIDHNCFVPVDVSQEFHALNGSK